MSCKHKYIRTWVFEDTKEPSGLWSCVDCGLKFEPITQRTWVNATEWRELTEDEFEDIELSCRSTSFGKIEAMKKVETKLKEKNAS